MIEEFTGYIRYEPEMRFTPTGLALTKFTVYDTDAGEFGHKERVITWAELAEACNQNLFEGAKVLIKGKRKTRTWTAPDGELKTTEEFVAFRVWELDDTPDELKTAKEIIYEEDHPF